LELGEPIISIAFDMDVGMDRIYEVLGEAAAQIEKKGGRPPEHPPEFDTQVAIMYPSLPISVIARKLGVSRQVALSALRRHRIRRARMCGVQLSLPFPEPTS